MAELEAKLETKMEAAEAGKEILYLGDAFRGADSEVLQVTVHSKEGGRLPQDVGYPYERVADLKLLESK